MDGNAFVHLKGKKPIPPIQASFKPAFEGTCEGKLAWMGWGRWGGGGRLLAFKFTKIYFHPFETSMIPIDTEFHKESIPHRPRAP